MIIHCYEYIVYHCTWCMDESLFYETSLQQRDGLVFPKFRALLLNVLYVPCTLYIHVYGAYVVERQAKRLLICVAILCLL